MRSLLVRIFASFFGATALVVLLMVGASLLAVAAQQRNLQLPRIAELASDAEDIAAAQGLVGLKGWAALTNARLRPIQLEVLDAAGARVTRTATGGTAEQPQPRAGGAGNSFVRDFTGPDGGRWRLVVVVPTQRLFGLLGEPRIALTLWPLAAVVFAIVCLLVARSISVPIELLRDATGRIARGDLDSGVAPALERRGDEIGQLARDFRVMADNIRELLQSKQQLIRDMSHELRTPLTRIRMGIELGASQATPAVSEQLARDVERLDALIGQMLRLASVNDPALTLRVGRVNVTDLLRRIAQDCAIEAAAREVEIRVEGPDDLVVDGDPDLLRSAFENVIRNAIRYSPDHGRVRVSSARADGRCIVRVCDQGIGVPEEYLRKIFEPLFRVAPARDTGTGGNGIGLAIVARVLGVHGGRGKKGTDLFFAARREK
ncbi:MAG: HAMP domain-containing histidine kinase [Steroidobacteraceae bacterium]|nr:HAMP domain-containing histidine kinase [Steroidobacteraceae bacterium]